MDGYLEKNSLSGKHLIFLASLVLLYAVWFLCFSYPFDSDHGRWMYETWRLVQGETLYKDIPWQYPPLSLYLYALFGKLFSPSVLTFSVLSTAIYLLICVLGYQWLKRVLPKEILFSAATATFLILAHRSLAFGGAPISTGMYSPSQPLGGLLTLALLLLTIKNKNAIAIGSVSALLFFTKQDFWGVLGVCLLTCYRRKEVKYTLKAWGTFGIILFITLAVLLYCSGWEGVKVALRGYSQGGVKHLIPDAITLARCLWSGSLWCLLAYSLFRKPIKPFFILAVFSGLTCFLAFKIEPIVLLIDPVYFFLPGIFAFPALYLYWKNPNPPKPFLFFTLLFVAIRFRRGIAGYDWYYPFVDLPFLYYVFQQTVEKKFLHSRTNLFFVILAFCHAALLIRNHPMGKLETIETIQGKVRTKPEAARVYKNLTSRLRTLDPSGTRPVLFLPNESLTYFTGLKNPTQMTQGFGMTLEKREQIYEQISFARPIVVMSRGLIQKVPDHYKVSADYSNLYGWSEEYQWIDAHFKKVEAPSDFGPWAVYLPKDE